MLYIFTSRLSLSIDAECLEGKKHILHSCQVVRTVASRPQDFQSSLPSHLQHLIDVFPRVRRWLTRLKRT